jgi:hypothetical protein
MKMGFVKKYSAFLAITFIGVSMLFSVASAQNQGGNLNGTQTPGTGLINPLCPDGDPNCSNSDVSGLLHSIVDWILKPGGIATTIAVGMVLVGAFQIMFAGGDPEKFKRGRTTILYTAIGYAIILVGWGLTSIIQDFLSH